MAGDWIAWNKGLSRKPEVLAIARRTRRDRREVACILMELWEWADEQTTDGRIPGVGLADLADLIPGTTEKFWATVEAAGWLIVKGNVIVIPNFCRWLGHSAKSRLQDTRRKQADRASVRETSGSEPDTRPNSVRDLSGSQPDKNRTRGEESRGEKRRGEKREEKKSARARRTAFVPPTLEEVRAYVTERQSTVDPQRFVDHYTAKGWRVGKTPMTNWKAALRSWETNGVDDRRHNPGGGNRNGVQRRRSIGDIIDANMGQ
jgi:hypothetical protein